MNRKAIALIMIILLNPILVLGSTSVYRPNDSTGAPENNMDSLYLTENGEIRDFSLSIPVISMGYDVVSAIAFRDVDISQFTTINDANLSLNFQLDFQEAPISLEVTVWGYGSDLGNETFPESMGLSSPLTAKNVIIDLQNITSPGFVDFDITEIVQEIISRESWSSGDTLGIIILSPQRNRARTYQSNYGINRPKLSIRYGEADYVPPSEEEGEMVDQYKEHDIWYSARGWRVLEFEDASGDGWFINVGNGTGTQTIYNYSLPFNIDLWETLQDTILVIGADVWALGDQTTNLTLYKSNNGGQSWLTMHSFTLDNSAEAWTMTYNEDGAIIHILAADDTNRKVFYMSYNITDDSELDAPSLLLQCENTGPYDMDITVDENNNLWIGIIGGGPWGSVTKLAVFKRDGGSWSGPRFFAGVMSWIKVDINYAWNKPNNDRPIYFVVADADNIYGDRIGKDEAIGALEFDSDDSPYMLSEPYVDVGHMKAILVNYPEEDDPYSDHFYIKVVYGAVGDVHLVPMVSATNFPNPSTDFYNNANYTNSFDQHCIYKDLGKNTRVWTQCNNELTRLYEMSTYWLEYGAYKKMYWDRRIMLTHHEEITKFSVPSQCFGELFWTIFYPNGTQIIPEEGSCMDICLTDAVTIEDVQACIDQCLIPGGGTSDDPSPGGWEDEGPFKRSSMRLYLFIIGWFLFWAPWFFVGFASGIQKVISFWVAIMISVIGLALLWGIPGI